MTHSLYTASTEAFASFLKGAVFISSSQYSLSSDLISGASGV